MTRTTEKVSPTKEYDSSKPKNRTNFRVIIFTLMFIFITDWKEKKRERAK